MKNINMTCKEADLLLYYLNTLEYVTQAKVYERTADACVCFTGDRAALTDSRKIKEEDQVVVHMGNVIPFDGLVTDGEGMVNQSSLTGESLPVHREKGGYVYAGSVLEEGELTVAVKKASGSSRYKLAENQRFFLIFCQFLVIIIECIYILNY